MIKFIILIQTVFSVWFLNLCSAQNIEPAIKIRFRVESSVTSTSENGKFAYHYNVVCSSSSEQKIWLFGVFIATSIPVNDIKSPQNWAGDLAPRGAVSWGGLGASGRISPGDSLNGFSFNSPALPAILDSYAQGFVPLPLPVDHVDETTSAQPDFEQDIVRFTTMGPSSFTFTNSISAISHLITLKHQAYSLGWISGPGAEGIVNSLDAKLDAALKAAQKGKDKTAQKEFKAFLNEIEAQKNKTFNNNVYQLLKLNAEYILGKLAA